MLYFTAPLTHKLKSHINAAADLTIGQGRIITY